MCYTQYSWLLCHFGAGVGSTEAAEGGGILFIVPYIQGGGAPVPSVAPQRFPAMALERVVRLSLASGPCGRVVFGLLRMQSALASVRGPPHFFGAMQ